MTGISSVCVSSAAWAELCARVVQRCVVAPGSGAKLEDAFNDQRTHSVRPHLCKPGALDAPAFEVCVTFDVLMAVLPVARHGDEPLDQARMA